MEEPILVFDDDCGFCTWCAIFIENRSDISMLGFSELSPALIDQLPDDYEKCSHLVTEEQVYSCGESIEEAITRSEIGKDLNGIVGFLRNFEDYEEIRERTYRWVAQNRDAFGHLFSRTPPTTQSQHSRQDDDPS